jgi:hypothetical protein
MRGVLWLVCSALPFPPGALIAGEVPVPIIDAHLHYNADVWEALPPERALQQLGEAGITRALVSATPAEGAERLYRLAPERVIPFLRPYANRSSRYTWFGDAATIGYVREQLARIPYRGIGEFHVFGDDARTPVVSEIIGLARERRLALQAHTDLAGMRTILEQAPDIPVIWAHAGFNVPVAVLDEMLGKHPQLYLELSFREGITRDGVLSPEWEGLFVAYPRHCLVGMDTYTPGRWAELADLADTARHWLAQLPAELAVAIAHGNAERLFLADGPGPQGAPRGGGGG